MSAITSTSRRSVRRMVWIVLAVAIGILLAVVASLLLLVEDWSRDLTQNTASTTEDATDVRLRMVVTQLPPHDVARLVTEAAASLPRWMPAESAATRPEAGSIELAFVRSTPLWRFKDDIVVTIKPAAGGGSTIHAVSHSRVGKGDLGQNPRNLRELLGAVRTKLADR